MHHSKTFLTPWVISLINMHHLKGLLNIKLNFELSLGLHPHCRNLFLLKTKFLKTALNRKTSFRKMNLIIIIKFTEISSLYWWSLLNCVPCVIKTCSRANVPYVLTCSRAKVPCVPACSRANLLWVLTCSRVNAPCVRMCSRFKVLCMLPCSHANVTCVLTCLRAHHFALLSVDLGV